MKKEQTKQTFFTKDEVTYLVDAITEITGSTKTAVFSEGILNMFRPTYNKNLVTEFAFLCNEVKGIKPDNYLITNDVDDERFNKEGASPSQFTLKQEIGRSISELKKHPIKNISWLNPIIAKFNEDINEFSLRHHIGIEDRMKLDKFKKLLGRDYPNVGQVSIALDLINRWNEFWDVEEAYDLFLDIIYKCNLRTKLEPIDAFNVLKKSDDEMINIKLFDNFKTCKNIFKKDTKEDLINWYEKEILIYYSNNAYAQLTGDGGFKKVPQDINELWYGNIIHVKEENGKQLFLNLDTMPHVRKVVNDDEYLKLLTKYIEHLYFAFYSIR